MNADRFGRKIDYLRISVTDRCNLRCRYCMPADGIAWRDRGEMLTYEEIERVAKAAVAEGVGKLRLTGGEPLVRPGLAGLVRRLREGTGVDRIALTTNGVLLRRHAEELREAGLTRVNISIDSLDTEAYARLTRGGRLGDALAGLDAALDAGFDPVKLNVVVMRHAAQDLFAFARLAVERPVHVRFIEFMPIGGGQCAERWRPDAFVPAAEILQRLEADAQAAGAGRLEALTAERSPEGWGPARYFALPGSKGTLGVISPMSRHVCGSCNRLRLTADGQLRPCLFSASETDIRSLLRSGATDDELRAAVRAGLEAKPAGHGLALGEEQPERSRTMSQIGG